MKSTLLLGLLLTTTGCTTLGGNIKGSFSCRAPGGTCAPMATIDRAAVSALGADATTIGAMPDERQSEGRMTLAGYPGVEPGRSTDRVLKIVFPAHADASGIYREEAVAHVVIERGSWVQNVAARGAPKVSPLASLDEAVASYAPSASASLPTSPPARPIGLPDAVAALAAPPIANLEPVYDDRLPATELAVGSEGAPSAEAIASARGGHRIGNRGARRAPQYVTAIAVAAEIERTRSLNRQSLQRANPKGEAVGVDKPAAQKIIVRSDLRTVSESRQDGINTDAGVARTRDPLEAARRVHDMALPLLAVPKPSVVELPVPNLADVAKPEPGQ